jgi:hypothetical protein
MPPFNTTAAYPHINTTTKAKPPQQGPMKPLYLEKVIENSQ